MYKIILCIWFLIILIFALISYRHSIFHAFDSGLYLQLAINFWKEGSFASSLVRENMYLSHHFQPTYYLFAPLIAQIPTSFSLAVLSLLMWVISILVLIRTEKKYDSYFWMVNFIFLLHPAIWVSVTYNFTPEVLAVPVYLWLGQRYVSGKSIRLWKYILALLWCGGCKENFILTNVTLSFLFLFKEEKKWIHGLIIFSQIAFFIFIFFFWMPENRSSPSYYPFSFFSRLDQNIAMALLKNFFSIQTLVFIFVFLIGAHWIAVFRPRAIFIAALPSLGMIMSARSPQVKFIANHYILGVLPFLWVNALQNRESFKKLPYYVHRFLRRWSIVLSLVVLILYSNVLDRSYQMYKNPRTTYFQRDTRAFYTQYIQEPDLLFIDGILQPYIPEHNNSQLLLSFWGNPVRITQEQLNSSFYVLTTEDLINLSDCREVYIANGNIPAFYHDFEKICQVVKERGLVLETYSESRLYAFYIRALNPRSFFESIVH